MARYLVKHMDNFTFTFTTDVENVRESDWGNPNDFILRSSSFFPHTFRKPTQATGLIIIGLISINYGTDNN
jgi:hypothetical protein